MNKISPLSIQTENYFYIFLAIVISNPLADIFEDPTDMVSLSLAGISLVLAFFIIQGVRWLKWLFVPLVLFVFVVEVMGNNVFFHNLFIQCDAVISKLTQGTFFLMSFLRSSILLVLLFKRGKLFKGILLGLAYFILNLLMWIFVGTHIDRDCVDEAIKYTLGD